jgi:hypothetical protein
MADEQPEKEDEVTPKGAVEIDEESLDQAAGGIIIINSQPADNVSLNYSKIDFAGQKVAPQNLTDFGPALGRDVAPEKKI